MKNSFIKNILSIVLIFAFILPGVGLTDTRLKILVTGFEEFGGYTSNPTNKLVKYINDLPDNELDSIQLKAITLPVIYYESWKILEVEINLFNPAYIISFGFAPGSHHIRIESIAENYDLGFPDNNNWKHSGRIIVDGLPSYKNELPIPEIEKRLRIEGIPTSISHDAGGYLCNHIFYQEQHYTSTNLGTKSGFFHVPDWPVSGQTGLWKVTKIIIEEIKKQHNQRVDFN